MLGKERKQDVLAKGSKGMSNFNTSSAPYIEQDATGRDVWCVQTENGVVRFTPVGPLKDGLPNGFGFISEPITAQIYNACFFGYYSQHEMIDDYGQKTMTLGPTGPSYTPFHYDSDIKESNAKPVFSYTDFHPFKMVRTQQLVVKFPTQDDFAAQKIVKTMIPPYMSYVGIKQDYLNISLSCSGELDEVYGGERVLADTNSTWVGTGHAMWMTVKNGVQSCFIGTLSNGRYQQGELTIKGLNGAYEYYAGGFSKDGMIDGMGTRYFVRPQLGNEKPKPVWVTGSWSKGEYEGVIKFVYFDRTTECEYHQNKMINIGTTRHQNGDVSYFQIIDTIEYQCVLRADGDVQTMVAGEPVEIHRFIERLYRDKNSLFLHLLLEKVSTHVLKQACMQLYTEQEYWAIFWLFGKDIGPLPEADCSKWSYVDGIENSILWQPFFNTVARELSRFADNDLSRMLTGLKTLFGEALLLSELKRLAGNVFPQLPLIVPKSSSKEASDKAIKAYRKEVVKAVLPWVMARVELIYQIRNQEAHPLVQLSLTQLNDLKQILEQKRNPAPVAPKPLTPPVAAKSRKKLVSAVVQPEQDKPTEVVVEQQPSKVTAEDVPQLPQLKHPRLPIRALVLRIPDARITALSSGAAVGVHQQRGIDENRLLLYRAYVLTNLQTYQQPITSEESVMIQKASDIEGHMFGYELFQLPNWFKAVMKCDANFFVLGLMYYLSGKEICVSDVYRNFEGELPEGYVARKIRRSHEDLTKKIVGTCFLHVLIELFDASGIPYQLDDISTLAELTNPRQNVQALVLPEPRDKELFQQCVRSFAVDLFKNTMSERLQQERVVKQKTQAIDL